MMYIVTHRSIIIVSAIGGSAALRIFNFSMSHVVWVKSASIQYYYGECEVGGEDEDRIAPDHVRAHWSAQRASLACGEWLYAWASHLWTSCRCTCFFANRVRVFPEAPGALPTGWYNYCDRLEFHPGLLSGVCPGWHEEQLDLVRSSAELPFPPTSFDTASEVEERSSPPFAGGR